MTTKKQKIPTNETLKTVLDQHTKQIEVIEKTIAYNRIDTLFEHIWEMKDQLNELKKEAKQAKLKSILTKEKIQVVLAHFILVLALSISPAFTAYYAITGEEPCLLNTLADLFTTIEILIIIGLLLGWCCLTVVDYYEN